MTKINKKGESLKQKFIFVDIGRKKERKIHCHHLLNLRWRHWLTPILWNSFKTFLFKLVFLSFRHLNFYSKLIFVEYHLYKPLYYGNNSKIYPPLRKKFLWRLRFKPCLESLFNVTCDSFNLEIGNWWRPLSSQSQKRRRAEKMVESEL